MVGRKQSYSRSFAQSPGHSGRRLWRRLRPSRRASTIAVLAVIVALLSPSAPASAAGLDVMFLSKPAGSVPSTAAAFAFRATDANYYQCRLDNDPAGFTTCAYWYDGTYEAHGLALGAHQLEVQAVDINNTIGAPSIATWTVDNAPTVTILSGPDDGATLNRTNVAYTFAAGDADRVECRYDSTDDNDWQTCGQSYFGYFTRENINDGTHTLQLRAVRGPDTGPTTTRTFTIASGLTIDILSGPADGATLNRTNVAYTFSSDDANRVECRYDSTDDNDWQTCGQSNFFAYFTRENINDGTHTLQLRAVRGPDTGPTTTRTFTIASGLTIDILSGPADGATLNRTNVAYTFSSDDANRVECRYDSTDDNDWQTCGQSNFAYFTRENINDGTHTLQLRAVRGPDTGPTTTRTFTIAAASGTDLTVSVHGPSGPQPVSWAAWDFHAPGANNYQCRYDSSDDNGWAYCGGTYGTNSMPNGIHTLDVRAVDPANNFGPVASTTVTVNYNQPTSLHGPSGTHPVSWAAWDFHAPGANNYQCRYDSSDDNGWAYCGGTYGTNSMPNGIHTLDVRAVDPANNFGPVASTTVTVNYNQPTSLHGPSGTHPVSWAAWDFHAPGANNYQCRYDSSDDNGWAYCGGTYGTNSMPNGTHTLDVRAVDPANNIGPVSTRTIDRASGSDRRLLRYSTIGRRL